MMFMQADSDAILLVADAARAMLGRWEGEEDNLMTAAATGNIEAVTALRLAAAPDLSGNILRDHDACRIRCLVALAAARWERLIGLSQPVCLFLLAKINSEL